MVDIIRAPRSRRRLHPWKQQQRLRLPAALLHEYGYIVLFACFCVVGTVLTVTSWLGISSAQNSIGARFVSESQNSGTISHMEEWCSTAECQERLETLRTKLELEDSIFQDQLRKAKAAVTASNDQISSTRKKTFSKQEILKESLYRMFDGDSVESEPRYQAKPEWKVQVTADGEEGIGSFPLLNVVGQIKTGTSQLYNIFATHQDVLKIPGDEKEHCSFDHYGTETQEQDLYEYAMFQWHDFYYRQKIAHAQYQHHVNGCLDVGDLELRYAYNPPAANTKFFFLVRDPADWAWAAYNFFCDHSSEEFEPDDNWVDSTIHYRSPEAFHELVLSGGKLKGSDLLTRLRKDSVWNLRRLRALVGEDNLIVLKNEDMQPHRIHQSRKDGKGSTLDYLARRAGLSKEGFDKSILESRSNCNANKGYSERCQEEGDRSKGVGYPVTQGRPMLESTRKFIYVQWYETCRIWAEEFGVVYPDCLSALSK